MSTLLFYRDQAARQQHDGDAALLDNVRNRCHRAAKAWTDLADRIERSDAARLSRTVPAISDGSAVDLPAGSSPE